MKFGRAPAMTSMSQRPKGLGDAAWDCRALAAGVAKIIIEGDSRRSSTFFFVGDAEHQDLGTPDLAGIGAVDLHRAVCCGAALGQALGAAAVARGAAVDDEPLAED